MRDCRTGHASRISAGSVQACDKASKTNGPVNEDTQIWTVSLARRFGGFTGPPKDQRKKYRGIANRRIAVRLKAGNYLPHMYRVKKVVLEY